MSGKNRLFKSGKTIRLRWDFCRSRILKNTGFRPEPESSTALIVIHFTSQMQTNTWASYYRTWQWYDTIQKKFNVDSKTTITQYLGHDICMESRGWYGSVQHQSESLWKANAVFSQCTGASCNWQHFPELLGNAVLLTWYCKQPQQIHQNNSTQRVWSVTMITDIDSIC